MAGVSAQSGATACSIMAQADWGLIVFFTLVILCPMTKKTQEQRRKAMKTLHADQDVEKKQTPVVVATLFHMIVAQPSYELPRPRPVPTCQLHFVTACCPLMSWPDHFCRWGQQLFNFFRVASSSQTVVALKATVFSIRVSARSFS